MLGIDAASTALRPLLRKRFVLRVFVLSLCDLVRFDARKVRHDPTLRVNFGGHRTVLFELTPALLLRLNLAFQ